MGNNIALSVLLFKYENVETLNSVIESLLAQETDFEYEILVDTSFLPEEERYDEEEYLSTINKVCISENLVLDSVSDIHYRLTNCICSDDMHYLQKYMDIVRRDNSDTREVMVSISTTAYNQEKYIARAIESLLMQEVDFRYEVIIGEDCSTDSTRAIIERYHRKHPDILKPIYHEHNVGLRENDNCIRRRLRGKYRAILEGDDFWIVKDRLKSHVDFLENNPEYIAIAGEFITVNNKNQIVERAYPHIYSHNEIYDLDEWCKWKMPTNTLALTHRNIFRDFNDEEMTRFENTNIIGDRRLYLLLLMYGTIYHTNEIIASRTILPASPTSWVYAQRHSNMCPTTHNWYVNAESFTKNYNIDINLSEKKIENWIIACKCFAKNPSKRNIRAVRYIYKLIPNNDKSIYRRQLYKETCAYLAKCYNNKNIFSGTFSIIRKGFKFIGKGIKNIFKKAENNEMIKKFI